VEAAVEEPPPAAPRDLDLDVGTLEDLTAGAAEEDEEEEWEDV
jgi:hypothetical protein